jgi:hypothetical protein
LLDGAAAALPLKSTLGAFEISASLVTVKLG